MVTACTLGATRLSGLGQRSKSPRRSRRAIRSKPCFEELLYAFAEEAGAGRDRIIVFLLDNAGWHGPANLDVPEGLRLVFVPPNTPELQAPETLWKLVDEPVVNKHIPNIETLYEIVSRCCVSLADDRPTRKSRTGFNWWSKIANTR